MEPGQAAIITALLVTLSKWAKKEKLTPNYIVGGLGVMLGLAALSEYNPKLASQFATLILATAALYTAANVWPLLSKSVKDKK